jgi:hypothetical protein
MSRPFSVAMMSLLLRSRSRAEIQWLAWPLTVVFLLALVLTGVHCHVNANASHGCAACSMSQAPATATTAIAVGVTEPPSGAMIVDGLYQPDHGIVAIPSSRGPPLG